MAGQAFCGINVNSRHPMMAGVMPERPTVALLCRSEDGTFANACSICDQALTEPIFATTHFVSDPADRMYRYSDSAMHWECYAGWKYQRRFAKLYFEAACQWKVANPYWATVAITHRFLLTANPNLPIPEADLTLLSIGPGFRIPISDWTGWLSGGWDSYCVHDLQRYALIEIEDELRLAVPNSDDLLSLAMAQCKGRPTR